MTPAVTSIYASAMDRFAPGLRWSFFDDQLVAHALIEQALSTSACPQCHAVLSLVLTIVLTADLSLIEQLPLF